MRWFGVGCWEHKYIHAANAISLSLFAVGQIFQKNPFAFAWITLTEMKA
jgi:hypothetical protein